MDEAMPLRLRPALLDRISARTDDERKALDDALGQALADLELRARKRRGKVREVQLVAQVVRAPAYQSFKKRWERTWADLPYGTAAWPRKLQEGDYGVLLLPLAAGEPFREDGAYPVLIGEPIFGAGARVAGGTVDDLILGMVVNWVNNPAPGVAPILAPPVIERAGAMRITDRRIEDYGSRWSVPLTDGP